MLLVTLHQCDHILNALKPLTEAREIFSINGNFCWGAGVRARANAIAQADKTEGAQMWRGGGGGDHGEGAILYRCACE